MEGNSKKISIIEFNGITGCGKSTTARLLEWKLKQMGFFVRHEIENDNKIINKNEIFTTKQILNYFYTLLQIWIGIKPIQFTRFYFLKNFFIKWRQIYTIQEKSKNKQIIVLEQGIIQEIASVAYKNKLLPSRKMKKAIKKFLQPIDTILYVNCECDLKISVERILNRKTNYSRLDKINNKKKLQSLLKCQKYNLNFIRKNININYSMTLNMESKPEENVDKIIRYLLEQRMSNV